MVGLLAPPHRPAARRMRRKKRPMSSSDSVVERDGALRRAMRGRDPGEEHRASTPLELLFDLTFVVAVSQAAAQLHHALAEGTSAPGCWATPPSYGLLVAADALVVLALALAASTLGVGGAVLGMGPAVAAALAANLAVYRHRRR